MASDSFILVRLEDVTVQRADGRKTMIGLAFSLKEYVAPHRASGVRACAA